MFTRNPVLLFLAAALCLGSASAQAATMQQSKMKQCNMEAQGKKGAERKASMKACLRKKATDSGMATDATKSPRQGIDQATTRTTPKSQPNNQPKS